MKSYKTGTLSTEKRSHLSHAKIDGVLHKALEEEMDKKYRWLTIQTAERVKERTQRATDSADGMDHYEQYLAIGIFACNDIGEYGEEETYILRVDRDSSWGLDEGIGEEGPQHTLVGGFAEAIPLHEIDGTSQTNQFKTISYMGKAGRAVLHAVPDLPAEREAA